MIFDSNNLIYSALLYFELHFFTTWDFGRFEDFKVCNEVTLTDVKDDIEGALMELCNATGR